MFPGCQLVYFYLCTVFWVTGEFHTTCLTISQILIATKNQTNRRNDETIKFENFYAFQK